jgi:hypothetical protein
VKLFRHFFWGTASEDQLSLEDWCLARSGSGIRAMKHQLRTVTVRIAKSEDGGVRAWSDDLPGLSLTCRNHEVLFAELTPKIASLLEQQDFESKIVREIHQFVVEVSAIQG